MKRGLKRWAEEGVVKWVGRGKEGRKVGGERVGKGLGMRVMESVKEGRRIIS